MFDLMSVKSYSSTKPDIKYFFIINLMFSQSYIYCQSLESSNEVRMDFFEKNKTLAMTSKMHQVHFSLASSLSQSYQGIRRILQIVNES